MTNALPCRSVYQISFPVKSGSMTGAVPGKLLRIPVQFAAHMGTDNIHLAELSFFCFIHPGFSLWGICHCTMSPQKLCRRFSRQMKESLCQSLYSFSAVLYDLSKLLCREPGRLHLPGLFLSTDHIPKEHSGHHGGTHPPFLKTCCHIPVRTFFRISADKRYLICCHTVLG